MASANYQGLIDSRQFFPAVARSIAPNVSVAIRRWKHQRVCKPGLRVFLTGQGRGLLQSLDVLRHVAHCRPIVFFFSMVCSGASQRAQANRQAGGRAEVQRGRPCRPYQRSNPVLDVPNDLQQNHLSVCMQKSWKARIPGR